MVESKKGGWGNPPDARGRPPMSSAFHDRIMRERRSKINWELAYGDMKTGVAEKKILKAGSYFNTTFPVVAGAIIGRTAWSEKKDKLARRKNPKSWAQSHIAGSEAHMTMDSRWVDESGLKVAPTKVVPPRRDQIKSLGNHTNFTPSKSRVRESLASYPRGTRASTFSEPMTVPDAAFHGADMSTVDLMDALKTKQCITDDPNGESDAVIDSTAAGPATMSKTAPSLSKQNSFGSTKVRSAPRNHPSVGYVPSIWAASGVGLTSSVPVLDMVSHIDLHKSKNKRIGDTFSGWTFEKGSGAVFPRSETQILEGVSKHRRKPSGFDIFKQW